MTRAVIQVAVSSFRVQSVAAQQPVALVIARSVLLFGHIAVHVNMTFFLCSLPVRVHLVDRPLTHVTWKISALGVQLM